MSHPFVERLIGTVRREFLDRTLFWPTEDGNKARNARRRKDAAIQKFVDERQHAGVIRLVAHRGKVTDFNTHGLRDLESKLPMEEDTIGRVHSEILGDVRPATTMVQVAALADPAAVLEVEADALVAS